MRSLGWWFRLPVSNELKTTKHSTEFSTRHDFSDLCCWNFLMSVDIQQKLQCNSFDLFSYCRPLPAYALRKHILAFLLLFLTLATAVAYILSRPRPRCTFTIIILSSRLAYRRINEANMLIPCDSRDGDGFDTFQRLSDKLYTDEMTN
jgi:hypothetical protein